MTKREELEAKIRELVANIDEVLEVIRDNLYKTSNKAAMLRTRKASVKLEKLFKEYRTLTVEYSKIKKEK